VLCEGGPILLGQLEAAAAVDDLFLTISPELVGGGASPRILEGVLEEPRRKKLEQLLEYDGELFARYGRR
jgi:riboflavin biosynthesis pyrimidine reductase